jgi:hypothetical protein
MRTVYVLDLNELRRCLVMKLRTYLGRDAGIGSRHRRSRYSHCAPDSDHADLISYTWNASELVVSNPRSFPSHYYHLDAMPGDAPRSPVAQATERDPLLPPTGEPAPRKRFYRPRPMW